MLNGLPNLIQDYLLAGGIRCLAWGGTMTPEEIRDVRETVRKYKEWPLTTFKEAKELLNQAKGEINSPATDALIDCLDKTLQLVEHLLRQS